MMANIIKSKANEQVIAGNLKKYKKLVIRNPKVHSATGINIFLTNLG